MSPTSRPSLYKALALIGTVFYSVQGENIAKTPEKGFEIFLWEFGLLLSTFFFLLLISGPDSIQVSYKKRYVVRPFN